MNTMDLFDFINANFTMRNNADCFNKLNCFADAMHQAYIQAITNPF